MIPSSLTSLTGLANYGSADPESSQLPVGAENFGLDDGSLACSSRYY